ncbi:MAG: hypothetical protein AAGH15_23300, partial [Myxococcota bacterium]
MRVLALAVIVLWGCASSTEGGVEAASDAGRVADEGRGAPYCEEEYTDGWVDGIEGCCGHHSTCA